jgi:hypothetical protein
MAKNTIANYLQQDSKTLGSLLAKLGQIIQWNESLKECCREKEPLLTKHCQIVNLSGKSLIAIADCPHWLTRLRFHIPELLIKLRKYPGLENIQGICCKVQPKYTQYISRKPRNPQKRPSPKSMEIILEITSKLKDERLRHILEKMAKH